MSIKQDYLQLLLQASRILSSTLNLEDVLSKIIELAMEIVQAEAASILLLDEKTGELVFDVALGEKGEKVKQMRLKLGEGIAGWVAEQKKSLIVNDVTKDPRWTGKIDQQFDFVTRSVMAVPLVYKTKLLGVIEVINRRDGNEFDVQSLQILEAFASQAAISVETSILFTNLKTEKEKLESVFSQMSDAAILIDSSYNIVFANPACKELIGESEIKTDIFSTFRNFNISPPDFNTIFKTKTKTVSIELSHKERQFYLSGKISSIVDDKKNITGYILTFRDVTEEKKEQLLKRNFLSLISHKLKTPLVSIIGYSNLLGKKFDETSTERRAMEVINKEGQYLNSLVEKLLNFTIIESGQLQLNKIKLNLADIVNKVITDMQDTLYDVDLIIAENLKEEVIADEEKISIVLKNLVENAVKFNDKQKKIVKIAKYELDNMTGIAVEDNGKGILPEQKGKLFDKFVQIEESFTGQVEGLGLGLAMCKLIIEAHSGKIGFETELDKGSKFYFVIPKANKMA